MNNNIDQPLWSEMWKGIASAELTQALVAIAKSKTLSHGELLYASGDKASALYGVKSGAIRLMATTLDGNESLTSLHGEGSWFGEISLFDDFPRPVDAYAMGETEILVVSSAQLQSILDDNPIWYKDFAKVLCHKLRITMNHFNTEPLPVAVRIALRLLDLAQVFGKQTDQGILIDIKLVQEDIAKMLLVRRQTVNINMRLLEKDNLVERQKGKILLRDTQALKDYIHNQS